MRSLLLPSAVSLLAACAAEPPGPPPSALPYTELVIAGEAAPNGIYDPSVEYDASGTGWLAYSGVRAGPQGEVETHIARSDDKGASWKHVTTVNTVSPASAVLPDGKRITGKWWQEVSALVHDPGDPGREWKLYWHRYITHMPHRTDEDRLFAFGWIATRHAPSPEGPWSEETALIGAGPFPLPPFETEFKIGDLGPDYANYIVLTEPGVLHHQGILYLALQAVRDPALGLHKHDIILISSADHGHTWTGAGKPLTAEAAAAFGATWFTGPSLAVEKGRVFLLVCPETASAGMQGHGGTLVFEFEDLAAGTLRKDASGAPRVIKRLDPTLSLGGQADYDEQNAAGGVIVPQFDMANLPRAFRIYNTGEGLAAD